MKTLSNKWLKNRIEGRRSKLEFEIGVKSIKQAGKFVLGRGFGTNFAHIGVKITMFKQRLHKETLSEGEGSVKSTLLR